MGLVHQSDELTRYPPPGYNKDMVQIAVNVKAEPIHVWHSGLTRDDENSAYRSVCPKCSEGILPVHRDGTTFEVINVDSCTLCGQVIVYEDEEIAGQKVKRLSVVKAPTIEPLKDATFWDAVRDNDT